MVSFGKAEVYIGYSAETAQRVMSALTHAGIHGSIKEVDHGGREGSLSDLPRGASMDSVKLYTVSVNLNDNAQARKVVGQVLQQKQKD